jgi:hypothetical protein
MFVGRNELWWGGKEGGREGRKGRGKGGWSPPLKEARKDAGWLFFRLFVCFVSWYANKDAERFVFLGVVSWLL